MLNAIFMLGSTYRMNKKVNIIFAIAWLVYMLAGANLQTGFVFVIMNMISFAFVFLLGNIFKGKYSNKIVSITSILIWSVMIDVICYFLYPQFTLGQTIFTYVGNGILFNAKYVFCNLLIILGVSGVKYLCGKSVGVKKLTLSHNHKNV